MLKVFARHNPNCLARFSIFRCCSHLDTIHRTADFVAKFVTMRVCSFDQASCVISPDERIELPGIGRNGESGTGGMLDQLMPRSGGRGSGWDGHLIRP